MRRRPVIKIMTKCLNPDTMQNTLRVGKTVGLRVDFEWVPEHRLLRGLFDVLIRMRRIQLRM